MEKKVYLGGMRGKIETFNTNDLNQCGTNGKYIIVLANFFFF
jgi:hypothetical protein